MSEHFSKRGKEHLAKQDIETLSSAIWELYIRKTMLLNDDGNPQVKVIEDANFVMISGNPEWKSPVGPQIFPQQPSQP